MSELVVAGVGVVAVLGIFVGAGVQGTRLWVKDLVASVRRLGGPDLQESLAQIEAQQAFAEVIALAVLADGEVLDAEEAMLHDLFASHPSFTAHPDDLVARLRAKMARVHDVQAFEAELAQRSTKMDVALREAAWTVVVALVERGATLQVGAERTYRLQPKRDARALLEVVARALGVDDSARERLASTGGDPEDP